ncbi:MAG: 4Fe-4S binding protein, partial [Dysgonomonas sp.]|nr:4Fe-4S binding protein [Dysgonomonas sp.]
YRALLDALSHFTELVVYFSIILVDYFSIILYSKCVRNCPAQAIDIKNPRKTDKSLCIACARCIYVCPQKARNFGGIIYKLVSNKFVKANSQRKEPEVVFI